MGQPVERDDQEQRRKSLHDVEPDLVPLQPVAAVGLPERCVPQEVHAPRGRAQADQHTSSLEPAPVRAQPGIGDAEAHHGRVDGMRPEPECDSSQHEHVEDDATRCPAEHRRLDLVRGVHQVLGDLEAETDEEPVDQSVQDGVHLAARDEDHDHDAEPLQHLFRRRPAQGGPPGPA